VRAPEPLALVRLLTDNPDTVTHVLEQLTGERLMAEVVGQYAMPAEPGNLLGVLAGEPVVRRSAVLKGASTATPYLYAESEFVPARLPDAVCMQLQHTGDPIGRVLATHGLCQIREEIPASGAGTPEELDSKACEAAANAAAIAETADAAAAIAETAVVWSRAYRLRINGLPVFAIREWFFRSAQEAFERSRPA